MFLRRVKRILKKSAENNHKEWENFRSKYGNIKN